MKFIHIFSAVVCLYNTMNLVGSGHDVRQRSVMVHKVDQGSNEFTHIGFYEIRSGVDLGRQLSIERSNDLIEITMRVSSVEILQTVGEQAESTADIYASGFHGL